jgi:hypothetical protein
MTNIVISEVRKRLQKFSTDHANDTDEKQHAQQFWRDFYFCFGLTHSSASMFEARVVKISGKKGYIDSFIPSLLIVEHKSFGEDLQKAYEQAQEYFHAIKNEFDKPKYIVVSDFKSFHLYDIRKDSKIPHICSLDKLDEHADWFMFLAEKEVEEIIEETPVNRKATFQISKLHDQLLKNNYIGRDLEVFLTRLVFCLFAEDTGLFGDDNQFSKLIEHTNEDGSDTGQTINLLFQVLNTPHNERQTNLDDLFKKFEYVNGSLFEEQIKIPFFDSELRQILLNCTKLDWSDISPAIFGSMFQAILEKNDGSDNRKDTRRELGAHYTSERNILKVIQPLFLNALRKEFEEARSFKQTSRLKTIYEKLPTLKFLDPACGCGNFLIVTYKELRNLENEIIQELFFKGQQGGLLDISTLCRVNIGQFYGIEIDEAAAHIARVALYITDHQLNLKSAKNFGNTRPSVPLVVSPHIQNANALEIDWNQVLVASNCSYIFGNPPFIGKKEQKENQKKELIEISGNIKGVGVLDYVCGWYFIASKFIQENKKIKCAFVSTNSISQGEQVGILWKFLFKLNIIINFAHRTFKWSNEGKGVAAVHCVIIGFGIEDGDVKAIYDYSNDIKGDPVIINAKNINPYLFDAPSVLIERRSKPICNVPEMSYGSMPIDDGHLTLTREDKDIFENENFENSSLIRQYIGGDEFINNTERYCLWLKNADPNLIAKSSLVKERIEKVKKFRLASGRQATNKLASYSGLFGEIRQPTKSFLLIPKVSSENREYMPIGIIDPEIIASGSALIIANATLYHFGILQSRMHMSWMRSVCGRMKSDYQYSASIVYNNFLWPSDPKPDDVSQLEIKLKHIIDLRNSFKPTTLSTLYNFPMQSELMKAHKELDNITDKIYGYKGLDKEVDRVAFLFNLYKEKIQ